MAENYQKQVDRVVELSNKLPEDSSIQDCDTILADYLNKCERIINDQINNNSNGIIKLVNAGLTTAEARQTLIRCIRCNQDVPKIEKIYTTVEELGNEFISGLTDSHAGEHISERGIGEMLVTMNDEEYILLLSGRVLKIKEE